MEKDNLILTWNMEDHTDRRYCTILMEVRARLSQSKNTLRQVDGVNMLEKYKMAGGLDKESISLETVECSMGNGRKTR